MHAGDPLSGMFMFGPCAGEALSGKARASTAYRLPIQRILCSSVTPVTILLPTANLCIDLLFSEYASPLAL
jgi:hypothetical protein